MSRDIRSYFTTLPKSTNQENNVKKRAVSSLNSSSDDVVPGTPTELKHSKKSKSHSRTKRKRIIAEVDSDAESDHDSTKKEKTKDRQVVKQKHDRPLDSAKKHGEVNNKPERKHTEDKRKRVNPLDAFGSEPINQSKVVQPPQTESEIHSDEDFDKTLLELDEEELFEKSIGTSTMGSTSKQQDASCTELKAPAPVTKKAARSTRPADDTDSSDNSKGNRTPARKRKASETDESAEDPDQARHERKRHSALLYQQYLSRAGPAHPGAKWVPQGRPDCLHGLCFIITGVLDSLQRDEAQALITRHGGRCTQSVSGKVNYMVLGEEAGPAKVEKARKLAIKFLTEDELIDLICTKSGIRNENLASSTSAEAEDNAVPDGNPTRNQQPAARPASESVAKSTESLKTGGGGSKEERPCSKAPAAAVAEASSAWVDKYRPTEVSQIIGQQGAGSNVAKLTRWLESWQASRGRAVPRPSPWARDHDGAFFRAALLSGPPGVGKTTSATLVCRQLGLDTVEFNASDTRNKRMVHAEVSHILSTTSLAGYAATGAAPTRRHALLMDEVDGMSGNEDRGGIQELIELIKKTNVPIICMCNDRQHPKIRTLANYCYDLRFAKPRLEQIRGAMMSICFKERINIGAEALTRIIQSTGQDVRQTLNQLALWAGAAGTAQSAAFKDVKLGPWEVVRKVFSAEEHRTMSLGDKSKLFFYDYSIGPLFVQENYLKVVPRCDKRLQLARFAAAADAISMGDVVDARIRSTQNWSLLELQAMYASVLPGHWLEGHLAAGVDFPGWLGKNSKANKLQRMLTEVYAHTRTSVSGDRTSMGLDYLPALRDAVVRPLASAGAAGVPAALSVMRAYNLLREDLANIVELSHWPRAADPFDAVDSKVKAAFTRAYNKEGPTLPYAAPGAGVSKARAAAPADDQYAEYTEENDSDDDKQDDIGSDAMIKAKKPAAARKGKAPAKPKASSKRSTK